MIEFKWEYFAAKWNFFGWLINFVYVGQMMQYTFKVYVINSYDATMNWLMLANILYPAIYEGLQMYFVGTSEYLSDVGNHIDLLYIWGSIAMSFVH